MQQHIIAINLATTHAGRDLNEADTRHQLIDRIIHEVLDWPIHHVSVEKSVQSGFVDYVLKKASGQIAIVIEAKREGDYFTMPATSRRDNGLGHISVRTLMTDKSVNAAIKQVRNYCLELGCSYAAITNGNEWVVFRVFEPGVDWQSLRAFVIPNLNEFSTSFTKIFNARRSQRPSATPFR